LNKIERAICRAIEPTLASHGFLLIREAGGFYRQRPFGFDDFLVVDQGTATFGPGIHQIGCPCGVRHDRIEIPWNSFGFIYGEENQKRTATIILGFPRGRASRPLSVHSDDFDNSVSTAAEQLRHTFLERALPFYDRFADLAEIEQLANEHPLSDVSPYTFGLPLEHRAMRGLLLAKAANPSRYQLVRSAFLSSGKKTLFPREECLEMLNVIDALVV
jgi:hypothetical protein